MISNFIVGWLTNGKGTCDLTGAGEMVSQYLGHGVEVVAECLKFLVDGERLECSNGVYSMKK